LRPKINICCETDVKIMRLTYEYSEFGDWSWRTNSSNTFGDW